MQSMKCEQNTNIFGKENKKLSVDDFTLISVLGKGSYGKVVMVRKRDTEEIYAMKIIKKKYYDH